jgi:dUTP pyrophosphatase
MQVEIQKLSEGASVPRYATLDAGAFDLHANEDGLVCPGMSRTFGTGLAFAVPDGHVMLLFSRSGHALKNRVRLGNCVGVIDADYRGEVKVVLTCEPGGQTLRVQPGDRIAQGMIIPVPRAEFAVVDQLADTARGAGGFGSTGK